MKYNIKIAKTLKTDNCKNFNVGSDIFFTLLNQETHCHDRYIGEIVEITEVAIIIKNVEVNGNNIDGEKIILLNDIEPNSCNYVYDD